MLEGINRNHAPLPASSNWLSGSSRRTRRSGERRRNRSKDGLRFVSLSHSAQPDRQKQSSRGFRPASGLMSSGQEMFLERVRYDVGCFLMAWAPSKQTKVPEYVA